MSGNKGMKNMIQTINQLQDKFNPLEIKLALDLPQIAVVGGQSAGKSSVLESFVGKDFLPRGSGIVTRRPLILQLIHSPDEPYGEFLHLPDTKFYDFNDIREEIESETDRVASNKGISSEPINLKIYSPDVVDLTLIDLPGLTKVPVGDQPKDIEIQIRKMILSYISKNTCLILAVTAANQDLATSDALQLAKEVDPEGKRTIGVLTKMDLMDEGTNSRDILDGKLLPLKRGYIGVINRSQKDIDSNKKLSEALAYEKKFFSEHSGYWDISDRLGTPYLQKFLNKELSHHIYKQLPELRDMCDSKVMGLEERLENMSIPEEEEDSEKVLSELNEQIRRDFELSVGRSASVKVDVRELSGGTRINAIMNDRYPNEVTGMSYDENRLRREIAVAIQNIHGIHLGIFTPDMAFEAVIRHQIEEFREPSLRCIDRISRELENIIKDCIEKIGRYPRIRELFRNIILKFVKECQKECKARMNYMVDIQLAYMNTKHEDFVAIKSDQQIMPSYESPKSQFEVNSLLNNKQIGHKGWINYQKQDLWFVLNSESLSWFRDNDEKDKKGSINLNEFQVNPVKENKTLILVVIKKGIFKDKKQMKLIFNSQSSVEKWKESLMDAGVKCIDDSNFYLVDSDSDSVSNLSIANGVTNGQINGQINSHSQQWNQRKSYKPPQEELELPQHLKPQIEVVKKLVESYVQILKKTFKDFMPKLVMLALIEETKHFIAVDLKLKVLKASSAEDMMGGDPDVEARKELINGLNSYKDTIAIIDDVLLKSNDYF